MKAHHYRKHFSRKIIKSALLFLTFRFNNEIIFVSGWSFKNLFKYQIEETKNVEDEVITTSTKEIIKSTNFQEGNYKEKLLYALNNDEKCLNDNMYGVDASFPIHRESLSESSLFIDRQSFYDEYIKGCVEKYKYELGKNACFSSEKDRLDMNLLQPQSMKNYTEIGFKKMEVPPAAYKLLKQFWKQNEAREVKEKWSPGNSYTNHWVSPTYMIPLPPKIRSRLAALIRPHVQEWIGGDDIVLSSLYGIRVYKEKSVLAPHVDRLPLVSSVIINVAQEVYKPWPIELYAHDGNAYNITMKPGEMILYESHSVIHGRPFPLEGSFFANVFIHFEPVGHSLLHEKLNFNSDDVKHSAKQHFQQASVTQPNLEPNKNDVPPYILSNTPEEKRWRQEHPEGKVISRTKVKAAFNNINAHFAAATGDLLALQHIAIQNPTDLFHEDDNGWQPIHEAARSGETKVLEFLLKRGADVNSRTNFGTGGTPLWWALSKLEDDHPSVKLLEKFGGVSIKPE